MWGFCPYETTATADLLRSGAEPRLHLGQVALKLRVVGTTTSQFSLSAFISSGFSRMSVACRRSPSFFVTPVMYGMPCWNLPCCRSVLGWSGRKRRSSARRDWVERPGGRWRDPILGDDFVCVLLENAHQEFFGGRRRQALQSPAKRLRAKAWVRSEGPRIQGASACSDRALEQTRRDSTCREECGECISTLRCANK